MSVIQKIANQAKKAYNHVDEKSLALVVGSTVFMHEATAKSGDFLSQSGIKSQTVNMQSIESGMNSGAGSILRISMIIAGLVGAIIAIMTLIEVWKMYKDENGRQEKSIATIVIKLVIAALLMGVATYIGVIKGFGDGAGSLVGG